MSDETVPTAEELGIDCEISKYNAVNYGLVEKLLSTSLDGWLFEETAEPAENQYVLNVKELMNEDDAAAADFSIDAYPEIMEIHKFTECGDAQIFGSSIKLDFYTDNSGYTYDENMFDYMSFYNDINALNETLTEKYDEIEKVDFEYLFPYSWNEYSTVYSVEPKWGDATNDDAIDLYDAIEISKYIMNISGIDEDTVLLADINRDGKTDLYDAIEVAKTLM